MPITRPAVPHSATTDRSRRPRPPHARACRRQHRFAVGRVLGVEQRRCRASTPAARAVPSACGRLTASSARLHFRTGGDDDALGRPVAVEQHIAAAADVLQRCRRRAAAAAGAWRVSTSSVGPLVCSMAAHQATAVSTASAGRHSVRFGISRRLLRCSIGWWVGPSSPRPMESWV